jgi:RuvB-like protein 2
MDEKRSVQWLKEQQGSLVFEEAGQADAVMGDAMEA